MADDTKTQSFYHRHDSPIGGNYAHGFIQVARGMCTDERPYPEIDKLLSRAAERVKDIEAERDRYKAELADARPRLDERRKMLDEKDETISRMHAKLDRYREALERIARGNATSKSWDIAREALND